MSETPVFRPKVALNGLAAIKAKAAAAHAAAGELMTTADIPTVEKATERIGIVFDDSGSMSGEKINDAHEGIEEFLRNCPKDKTAVAIYPMNAEKIPLSLNLPALALIAKGIPASGGTPLVKTSKRMIKEENITRMIIFSDGEAGDNSSAYGSESEPIDTVIAECIKRKITVDTIFIAESTFDYGEILLKKIASQTGGVYMRFEKGKTNFKTAFKYLSPAYRAMLCSSSFVQSIQDGKV